MRVVESFGMTFGTALIRQNQKNYFWLLQLCLDGGGPKNSIVFYYWTQPVNKNRCKINYEIYLGDPNTASPDEVRYGYGGGNLLYTRDTRVHNYIVKFPVSELNDLESIKKRLKEQISYDIDSSMKFGPEGDPQGFTEETKDMLLDLIDEVNLIELFKS